jgi:hypothetical protein
MAKTNGKGARLNDTTQMCAIAPKVEERALNCLNCVKYEFCREICPEIEALLPKKTTGRHKKEASVSLDYLEILAVERSFKLRFGKKYDIFKHKCD